MYLSNEGIKRLRAKITILSHNRRQAQKSSSNKISKFPSSMISS